MKSKTVSHNSHGLGDAIVGHHRPNIAQDGAPKRVEKTMIHDGMSKTSKLGLVVHGAAHADALDSLSGLTVVPGRLSKPGAAATAHPLIKPPVAKGHLGRPVPATPGMKSQQNADCEDYATKQQHGRDMLDCAVKN